MRSQLAIMLLICSVSFVEAGATPADPSHVVESLHAVLIEAMQKSDTLSYQARVDLIWPIAATSIDQKFMAEKSIGRYWKKMSESEKNTWQKTFTNLTVANYAGRFTGYTGEIFETKSVEDAPRETKLVNTVLILPDDEDVVLNYRMRMTDSGWKIIDIYMNGTVSELSLRRSEYSTTLKRSGFEALVEALEEKIVTLSESNSVQIALPAPDGSPASP